MKLALDENHEPCLIIIGTFSNLENKAKHLGTRS